MKILFFLLVLLNIVFYLWSTGVGKPPETAPEPPAQGSVERIVLIKELPQATRPTDALPPPSPQAASTEPPQPPGGPSPATSPPQAMAENPVEPAQATPACQQIGPFATLRKAQVFKAKLKIPAESAKPVKTSAEVENGYLILYPAAETLPDAKANLKMLKDKGAHDAWLIEQGEYRYAISLATTNDKKLAEDAVARYQAKGIAAELKTRKTLADKWWLEITGEIDPAALQTLLNRPDAGLGTQACGQ